MKKYKWHKTEIPKCYLLELTVVIETANPKETFLGIIMDGMKWCASCTKIDSTLKLEP